MPIIRNHIWLICILHLFSLPILMGQYGFENPQLFGEKKGSQIYSIFQGRNSQISIDGVTNPVILQIPVHIATTLWKSWWFILLVISAIALAIYSLHRYRMQQFKAREQLKTEFEKKLAHVEMSALLAQMNPHFLFNSLNSIESYILSNKTEEAAKYLNNFSRLMRLILQHSRSDYISLSEEIKSLELYLEMEHIRFKDKFQYEMTVQPDLEPGAIDMPPMLIQPYLENAIWHGLMHKEDRSKGRLQLCISREGDTLKCVIEDNGIGRKKARDIAAQKSATGKKSMGIAIAKDRIKIMSQLYNYTPQINIIDLHDQNGAPRGTRVELNIPI